MAKAYSYIRFSTASQRFGDSLRRQTEGARQWAAANGLDFDESLTYQDLGVSGYDGSNLERGALGVFLQGVRSGRIKSGDTLIIEALDRLTRVGPLDALNLLTELVTAGITIVTAVDGQVYTKERLNTDISCLVVASIILSRGHEESRQKSSRLKEHFAARRAQNAGIISHVAPHWLRPENGRWVVVPDSAATIKRIFELSASGVGVTKIAQIFNAEEVPIPRTTARALGDGWYPPTIAALLKNRAVIGHYQPCQLVPGGKYEPVGDVIENHYPEVVPPTLFWTVQDSLAARRINHNYRRDSSYHNILSGILKCGECGGNMHLLSKNQASADNRFYYLCPNAARGRTACNVRINYRTLLLGAEARTKGKHKRGTRYGLLPQLIDVLLIHRLDIATGADKRRAELDARVLEMRAKLSDINSRIARLIDTVEDGVFKLSEIGYRMEMLRETRLSIEDEVEELERERLALVQQSGELGWIEERQEEIMSEILPLLRADSGDNVGRAQLRNRLAGAVEKIDVFQNYARVMLRNYEYGVVLPLAETENLFADTAAPL